MHGDARLLRPWLGVLSQVGPRAIRLCARDLSARSQTPTSTLPQSACVSRIYALRVRRCVRCALASPCHAPRSLLCSPLRPVVCLCLLAFCRHVLYILVPTRVGIHPPSKREVHVCLSYARVCLRRSSLTRARRCRVLALVPAKYWLGLRAAHGRPPPAAIPTNTGRWCRLPRPSVLLGAVQQLLRVALLPWHERWLLPPQGAPLRHVQALQVALRRQRHVALSRLGRALATNATAAAVAAEAAAVAMSPPAAPKPPASAGAPSWAAAPSSEGSTPGRASRRCFRNARARRRAEPRFERRGRRRSVAGGWNPWSRWRTPLSRPEVLKPPRLQRSQQHPQRRAQRCADWDGSEGAIADGTIDRPHEAHEAARRGGYRGRHAPSLVAGPTRLTNLTN